MMDYHSNRNSNVSTQTILTTKKDCSTQYEEQPIHHHSDWLPLPFKGDTNRLCEQDTSMNLTDLQRLFMPVFPSINQSNECYPLLTNHGCMYLL